MKKGFIGIIFVRQDHISVDLADRSDGKASPQNRRAVKNCYLAKFPWPSPAQNASAESKGASSPRSVLTDVNKSHSQRFDPLSQPLVWDAIPRDHPLFTGYRSPTGGRLFRGRTA